MESKTEHERERQIRSTFLKKNQAKMASNKGENESQSRTNRKFIFKYLRFTEI